MKDVIIIGSGLGGLECGYILAREGYHVLILERERQPGGCMQSYRRDGVELDTGFHYVGGLDEGQPLHAPFRMLGLLKLPWVRLDADCFDRIHISGESYDFAQGYSHFVETLADRFPKERQGLEEYVEMLQDSRRHQLDWLDPAKSEECGDMLTNIYGADFSTPAWQWLHEHIHDARLIDVLAGNAVRMELRKDTLPFFTLAHFNSSFIASSYRLRGSGRLIADTLIHDIEAHGGRVVCNAEVSELVEEDGRIVKAICSNGDSYEADTFISDVHPMLTYDLVKAGKLIRKSLKWRMHSMENTYGMLTVSLIVKPGALRYVGHNDYIYSHPNIWDGFENDSSVSGVLVSYRVPEDGSDNVRVVDLMTPVPWEECKLWTVSSPGHRPTDYMAWKERKAREALALAATEIPGLMSMVEKKFVSSPLTYRDYTLTPCGSAYGMRKDCGSPLLTVLSPRTPEPNLFLTGQSLMLHGVEGVTMTAMMTCAEIVGKETIWNKLYQL
jgi:all-trans-retinol 13,14-reductase